MCKDSPTVKQHYVPQCYIRNFYNSNKKVECWNAEKNYKFKNDKSSKSICYEDDLYEWDKKGYLNDIEDRLDKLENELKPIIDNLFKYFDRYNLQQGDCLYLPKIEDLDSVVIYLIIQLLRVPNMIHSLSDMIGDMFKKNKELNKLIFENETVKNSDMSIINAALKGKGLDFFFKNPYIRESIYDTVKKTHKIVVFKTEHLHFLSSDEPVVIDFMGDSEEALAEGNGFLLFEKSNFYFALSPKYCLGLLLPNKDYEDIEEDEFALRTINYKLYEFITELLVMASNKYIYSDKIDEKVEKVIKRTLLLKEKFKKEKK